MTENTKQNNEDSDLDSHLKRLEEMLVEFERLRNEVVRLQSAEGFSSLFGTDGVIDRIDEIIKNCLLYTSPSPRDLSTSRMPSSA